MRQHPAVSLREWLGGRLVLASRERLAVAVPRAVCDAKRVAVSDGVGDALRVSYDDGQRESDAVAVGQRHGCADPLHDCERWRVPSSNEQRDGDADAHHNGECQRVAYVVGQRDINTVSYNDFKRDAQRLAEHHLFANG